MDLEGLSIVCAGLGNIEEDDDGNRIGYSKAEFCLDNLKDLQRFLRRDDPQCRDVFKQVCKWKIVSKDLIPIIEFFQEDRDLVITSVKILVFLTMPIEPGSKDIHEQIDHLWGLKAAVTRNDTIAVIVSLLERPLENLDREAFTEDDWKLVQLVLTLFRNILAIQDISLQQKASGSAAHYLFLRDRFIELLFNENVMDLILVLTQHVGGSCGYLRQDNLLLLEIFHFLFMGQEPRLVAKASQKRVEVDEDVKDSFNSLMSIMEEEKEKRRRARLRNLDRHSQFSGTFTRLGMGGSKTLLKGNPGTSSTDSLVKCNKVHRGPLKRIASDTESLTSSNENILVLLHDFINQFLSAGYNVLMQSIREDIIREHHTIQNNDVLVFFQVAQFVKAFQHNKFLIAEPKVETDASEAATNTFSDSTLFQGNICGPIAATLNEAMFLLVISKWRYAFEALKETNDYKFLSVAGSLMKNMIRMLDMVLKLFPEDAKETQTARILLYKIFYDQTDQGMTQFLLSLLKSFDTHKQSKSDLADLVEMIHVVLRLLENLQARGTLRVSKKSRRGKKKKTAGDKSATVNEQLGDDQVDMEGDLGKSAPNIIDAHEVPEKELLGTRTNKKDEGILVDELKQPVDELERPLEDVANVMDGPSFEENKESFQNLDDLECGNDDSSEDDPSAAIDEVDFNVSSLVSTFANNSVIQKLCWLLRFYKTNSASTNHFILSMLQRISEDMELSPMLYQLSILSTFNDILVEQKLSTRKEYENIISFITDLVRRMLRKMKRQPLLFVDILFWKTRKECHYINSESLLNELGNLRKESRHWGNEGETGPSQGLGGTGRRSIADALGDDEFDLGISQEHSYQKEKDKAKLQKVRKSRSGSDSDGVENNNLDDALNEEHSSGHESLRVPKRKKRLVFDTEMETNIKSLYEKYKDERSCSRLIAEALDPDGGVSPVQVSNKLKQLGLKVASKKRIHRVDDSFHKGDADQIGTKGQASESDSTLRGLGDLERISLLKQSSRPRKRVRAFSKEQEMMVKDLYEQFKHHKRCSHMIATSLGADNTFTAAQVSRKLKQLGLIKEKMSSEAEMQLRDEDVDDTIIDEVESDEETLLDLKKRSKKTENRMIFSEGVTSAASAEQDIETTSPADDNDDEVLSSILGRSGKKLSSITRREKRTTSSIEETQKTIDGTLQNEIIRDKGKLINKSSSSHIDVKNNVSDMDGTTIALNDENKAGSALLDNANDEVPRQLKRDELEDSGDDLEPIASTNVVLRRKMKMVIDMDDE